MNLTKTQESLIEAALASPSRIVTIEVYHGRGPQGGHITGGQRALKAVTELLLAGILEKVSYEQFETAKRGHSVWTGLHRFRLTKQAEDELARIT